MSGGEGPVPGVSESTGWEAADSDVVESMIGTTVGKYEILSEIGRGGTGVVYLARQRDLERKVALKALHGAGSLGRGAALGLVAESRLAGSLNHPNIVTVYEYLGKDGTSYIAMEYVPRGSLRLWVGYLSLAQLAGVLEGLLAGLAAVEPQGIVHRDLKPENVMVTADGRVKIADFGIAKATQAVGTGGLAPSTGGMTVGTPAYMAPEQALGEEVGPWTDLYSIGIMAYENLLGDVPFHDTSAPMGMLLRRIRDPVPAPADVDHKIDRSLSDWVAGLLVREPADRVSSAVTAWEDLEEILIGLLGPRWRREARLTDAVDVGLSAKPLTPAPFMSQRVTMQTLATADAGATPGSADTPNAPTTALRLPRRRERTRASLRLVAGAGVVLAATAGFVVARAVNGTSASGHSGARAVAGGMNLSLPAGWRATKTARPTPGYEIAKPVTLIPPGGEGSLTLGLSTAASAALTPAGLLSAARTPPKRETISLGSEAFFRFPTVVPGDATGTATVYTQPTTAGVLVGVCRLPAAASTAVNAGCEQGLGTLTLTSARALPLEESVHYATTLTGILTTFNARRNDLASQLAHAQSARAQAVKAQQLGEAAGRAAAGLRGAAPGPSEQRLNAALVKSLTGIDGGYAQMSTGARGERKAVYDAGVGAVAASSGELQRALAQLAASG